MLFPTQRQPLRNASRNDTSDSRNDTTPAPANPTAKSVRLICPRLIRGQQLQSLRVRARTTSKIRAFLTSVGQGLSPKKWQAYGKRTFSLCRANQRKCLIMKIAGSRIRTDDLLITNQLLYQLSYAGVPHTKAAFIELIKSSS
jgi:hypothetical protein